MLRQRNGEGGALVGAAMVAVSLSAIGGCATSGNPGGDRILKPQAAYRAPDMDFTRIEKVGVFPLFAEGATQDEAFAENLGNTITAELKEQQSQWDFLGPRQILTVINEHDLGGGYQNLQADFNTWGGGPQMQLQLLASQRAGASAGMNPMVARGGGFGHFSDETRTFLTELREHTEVDAFLIGSYALGQVREMRRLPVPRAVRVDAGAAEMSLYFAQDQAPWWRATMAMKGARNAIVDDLAQGLASYLGKGQLFQLEDRRSTGGQ